MKDSSEFQQLLDKYIDTDRINHAYLIETNCHDRLSIAHQLIEKLLDLKKKNMTIESLFINNDLYTISTDAQIIKKEEIINLKNSLKTKSLYSGYRVYIIEEAEKLNMSSANTLLKFLEEPDDNIIAVLITNNRYNVIETIISRCQIIRYYNKDEESNIELPDNYEQLINFVKSIEENKVGAIGEEGIYFTKEDYDRKRFQDNLTNMLYIYYDILQKKAGLKPFYSSNYINDIEKIANKVSFNDLNMRIKSVSEAINKLKYNTNTRLVLDSMIIDAVGGVENV